MDTNEMVDKLEEEFGSRLGFMAHQIQLLSMTGQRCDVTFYEKKPAIEVKIDQTISLALMYGAGAKKLKELLENIGLSNGDTISFREIWTINPMPVGGIPKEELDAVDMAEAEEQSGPNGETLRKMISETYHCETKEEEDQFLRRFIAS